MLVVSWSSAVPTAWKTSRDIPSLTRTSATKESNRSAASQGQPTPGCGRTGRRSRHRTRRPGTVRRRPPASRRARGWTPRRRGPGRSRRRSERRTVRPFSQATVRRFPEPRNPSVSPGPVPARRSVAMPNRPLPFIRTICEERASGGPTVEPSGPVSRRGPRRPRRAGASSPVRARSGPPARACS